LDEDREQWTELVGWLGRQTGPEEGPPVVVFDADGTLWADDLGERHLALLGAEGLVSPSVGYGSLLEEYEARCGRDFDAGYGWAVQCMAGLAEGDVVTTSRAAWRAHRDQVPGTILALLDWCDARGLERWIVSASHRWAIEEAAADLGFAPERVLAMEVEVEDGVLTSRLKRPLPNGAGKVSLIEAHVGRRPWMAAGNSRHDLEMLGHAERALVVRIGNGGQPMPTVCRELRALGPGTHEIEIRLQATPGERS
jgi:phosphoserine phosphatase